MTSDDPPRTPLGMVVAKHFKSFEFDLYIADRYIEKDYPTTKGLARWYLLNYHLISNRAETEKHLHGEQLMSYHLLFDWWTAAYQDAAISLSEILRIVSRSADLEQLAGANWSERFAGVLNHLALRTFPEREDLFFSGPLLQEDDYNTRMRKLFDAEFIPLLGRRSFHEVHEARQEAIAAVYTQRAAVNCFTHGTGLKTYGSITTSRGYPIISSPMLPLDHGPSLESCDWLPPLGDKLHCIPYYLWDVAERKTVCTNTFTEFPSYTCISHTWGRSRLDSEARVEGVSWSIPRNSKFEVESLPSLLRNVPTKTPYVWLDLVCIPQDGSDIGTKEIAAKEIARQGEIFRAAQRAVIWLNDVDELDVLSNLIQWIVLRFLQIPEESEEQRLLSELRDQAWKNIAGKSTNLFAPGAVRQVSDFGLNPWFTSLWTLQEVCLRPDMWLCARDWSFLSIDGKTALPLDGLLCIQNRFLRHHDAMFTKRRERKDNPEYLPVQELELWICYTGFIGLLRISRVGILALGDGRHCTERRAEAIMSVLDVTDWYKLGKSNDRELVLGKYPLAFVEELKRKNPSQFFSAFNRSLMRNQLGSLLPFGSGYGNVLMDLRHMKRWGSGHPSLYSWTIGSPNGRVHIERACIISPPRKGLERPEGVFGAQIIFIPYYDPRETRATHDVDNLHAWVRNCSLPIYFVATEYVLQESPGTKETYWIEVYGVVICELVGGSMLKVGSFSIAMGLRFQDPEDIAALAYYVSRDEEVNWTVI